MKLLTHSERTMGECVLEDTRYIGDETTWKKAWLCIASKHRVSELGELEKV